MKILNVLTKNENKKMFKVNFPAYLSSAVILYQLSVTAVLLVKTTVIPAVVTSWSSRTEVIFSQFFHLR